MFYLILSLLFLEKLASRPLQELLTPAKDGFKCSNCVSSGPSSTVPSKGRNWKILGGGRRGDMEEKLVGKQLGENDPPWVTAPEILPESQRGVTAAPG